MKKRIISVLAVTMLAVSGAPAQGVSESRAGAESVSDLQCVPYARQVSGIRIFGDAHTWWGKAAGRYERGHEPRVGAVMAFQPHGNMKLGHVAAVSKIVDSRTVLLRHANWSLINGRRGQIEDDVRAVDVSEDNDWSRVRVWYAPIGALGSTQWPLHGFIYNDRAENRQWTSAPANKPATPAKRRDIIGEIIAASGQG